MSAVKTPTGRTNEVTSNFDQIFSFWNEVLSRDSSTSFNVSRTWTEGFKCFLKQLVISPRTCFCGSDEWNSCSISKSRYFGTCNVLCCKVSDSGVFPYLFVWWRIRSFSSKEYCGDWTEGRLVFPYCSPRQTTWTHGFHFYSWQTMYLGRCLQLLNVWVLIKH